MNREDAYQRFLDQTGVCKGVSGNRNIKDPIIIQAVVDIMVSTYECIPEAAEISDGKSARWELKLVKVIERVMAKARESV